MRWLVLALVLGLAGCGSPVSPERPRIEYKHAPDSVATQTPCDPFACQLRPVRP